VSDEALTLAEEANRLKRRRRRGRRRRRRRRRRGRRRTTRRRRRGRGGFVHPAPFLLVLNETNGFRSAALVLALIETLVPTQATHAQLAPTLATSVGQQVSLYNIATTVATPPHPHTSDRQSASDTSNPLN